MWEAWAHLTHSVQTGENAFRHVHGRSNFEHRSLRPAEQAIFDQAMSGGSRGLSGAVMRTLDTIRDRVGVRYPGEEADGLAVTPA